MNGRLLTARAVADLLEVTPATILRWTRRGQLPAIRLPSGAVRYAERELDAWLAARATPAQREVAPTTLTADAALAARSTTLRSLSPTTRPSGATDNER